MTLIRWQIQSTVSLYGHGHGHARQDQDHVCNHSGSSQSPVAIAPSASWPLVSRRCGPDLRSLRHGHGCLMTGTPHQTVCTLGSASESISAASMTVLKHKATIISRRMGTFCGANLFAARHDARRPTKSSGDAVGADSDSHSVQLRRQRREEYLELSGSSIR